jgi:hypothetical protein
MKARHLFASSLIILLIIAAIVLTMTTPAASKIMDSFQCKTLAIIATATAPPTYSTIRKAQTQLNSNAMSIPSLRGDGILGHLALTISPADYQAASLGNVPFIAPPIPPIAPVHQQNATAFQIAENLRQWKEDQATFRTYHDVDKALRIMLIDAVHDTYLAELHHDDFAYGNRTTLEVLTYLWDTYSEITPDDLALNTLRMTKPWNPPTPIEDMFKQVADGVKFATAGGEIPPATAVVRICYDLVEASGVFETPCREWRKLATADKTLANFKTAFKAADKDRQRTVTSSSAGFHANAANRAPPVVVPSTAATTLRPADTSYCWTHGCINNKEHTSITCNNKKEGHQDDATLKNKKGGSTKIWARRE